MGVWKTRKWSCKMLHIQGIFHEGHPALPTYPKFIKNHQNSTKQIQTEKTPAGWNSFARTFKAEQPLAKPTPWTTIHVQPNPTNLQYSRQSCYMLYHVVDTSETNKCLCAGKNLLGNLRRETKPCQQTNINGNLSWSPIISVNHPNKSWHLPSSPHLILPPPGLEAKSTKLLGQVQGEVFTSARCQDVALLKHVESHWITQESTKRKSRWSGQPRQHVFA